MTADTGWWECARCHKLTDEPHTDVETNEDICFGCCLWCQSGACDADMEQQVLDRGGHHETGQPVLNHGIPNREQSAMATRYIQ